MIKTYILLFFLTLKLFANEQALLYNGNCTACHKEDNVKSAPSMREIKKRYKAAFSEKREFIKYMTQFVIDPKEEHSIMSDKIIKYKIMPLLGYEKSVIEDIATYIYEKDFR